MISEWLQAFARFVGVFVAGVAGWIAWRQATTNRSRLRLELFERRMDVFTRVHVAVSKFISTNEFDEEEYGQIVRAWQESRFLFSREIQDCVEAIRHEYTAIEYGSGEERKAARSWLLRQPEEMFVRFGKFMRIEI